MAAEPKIINTSVSVGDPTNPGNVIKPNADGSVNVKVTSSVVAPAYQSAGAGQFGLAVAGVAVALTPPAGATAAQITINGASMRYRDDGTDPTAAVGMSVIQGASWFYSGPLSAIKFIAQAGNGTLDVSYYK